MTSGHFEDHVIQLAGQSAFNAYQADLMAMSTLCQERVIYALERKLTLPDAVWHVVLSKKLPELNFTRYMNYVVSYL